MASFICYNEKDGHVRARCSDSRSHISQGKNFIFIVDQTLRYMKRTVASSIQGRITPNNVLDRPAVRGEGRKGREGE